MSLSLLLNNPGTRFGIDGGAISTYRSSPYLKDKLQQAQRHFHKFNVIPTGFKAQYAPVSKIVFSNPMQTGLNTLLENNRLLGKHYISGLEPYCLVQFDSRLEAEAFKRKITAYLQKDRSHSTVVFDSDLAVGKLIPEHCFPGETLYLNSKSKKRTDVAYVSEDKLEPEKWVCKFEVRLKSATEVKRLTGISDLGELADLVGQPQKIKLLMERLLKNVYPAKVDTAKLGRWLIRWGDGSRRANPELAVFGFLRMVASAANERADGEPTPPAQFEHLSYAMFKQGIKRLQEKAKACKGRKSKYALALLDLDPSRFKMEVEETEVKNLSANRPSAGKIKIRATAATSFIKAKQITVTTGITKDVGNSLLAHVTLAYFC